MLGNHTQEFAATYLPMKINADHTWLDFKTVPRKAFLNSIISERVLMDPNFIVSEKSFYQQYACSLPVLAILLLLDYEIYIQNLDSSGAFKHSYKISSEDCGFD